MLPMLSLFLLLIQTSFGRESDVVVKSFTINMDLPADVRLKPLCEEYKEYVVDIYEGIITTLPPDTVKPLEDIMVNWFLKNAIEPYRSEMYYISQCAKVPLGAVVTMNLLYDMTAACTSIVAEDENGIIYHGRNLDYGDIPILRNATYIATYINNNSDILYVGTPFFGYSGLWTGFKQNAFSISGDERDQGSIIENIESIHDDYWPSGWLIRDVLMNENNFEQALNRLNNTKLMAPVYYILGGTYNKQGAIITRDQEHSYNLWLLQNSALWYQIETNYDWWLPPPAHDDRRDPAIKAMNNMGQSNLNQMNLYNDVMSKNPVLNGNTIYTVIMSAVNQSAFYVRARFP